MIELIHLYAKRDWVPMWLWNLLTIRRDMSFHEAEIWVKARYSAELEKATAIIDAL